MGLFVADRPAYEWILWRFRPCAAYLGRLGAHRWPSALSAWGIGRGKPATGLHVRLAGIRMEAGLEAGHRLAYGLEVMEERP